MTSYDGPAGVVFTRDECLLIWQALTLRPTAENAPARKRIERFLRETASETDKASYGKPPVDLESHAFRLGANPRMNDCVQCGRPKNHPIHNQ